MSSITPQVTIELALSLNTLNQQPPKHAPARMKTNQSPSEHFTAPINAKDPIRIAFLGGQRTGKTAAISKLTYGSYSETYYPTRKTTPVLFTYSPSELSQRLLLDDRNPRRALEYVSSQRNMIVSPVVSDALVKGTGKKINSPLGQIDILESSKNDIYASSRDENGEICFSPILTELIDTPAFNADQFIPFLEASLYARLGKDVLRNLADEPRQPVNTEPLLVASGAGEMNGAIDGYCLFYSAVPSLEPPNYDAADDVTSLAPHSSADSIDSHESYNADGTLRSVTFKRSQSETSFSLLPMLKAGLEEAWNEYYTYKLRWDQGQEKDLFSIKSALRNMFESRTDKQITLLEGKLLETPINPADPSSSPPVWIVCTHKNSPLASPKLVDDGKKLAKLWKCGYVALDIEEDVGLLLAMVVRDLAERRVLQKNWRRR